MKILLAVDGSAGSDAAVRQIIARPWPTGSEVKIISVVELLTTVTPENFWVPDNYYLHLDQSLQEQARTAIDRAVAKFNEAGSQLTVRTEIINGVAKEVIVQEAERWEADLIVLGSHGHSGLRRFLFGSVSQAVLSQAHCSVEIVREQEAPEGAPS